ncbi:hypothetical protein SAMN05444722_0176 [Rhodovulum sp. ES.010]|uniref:hypothetical protein n=1 Tax=Rhodovulum sp. ES.010 TaxID=1882821 RepID=UPI00092CA3E3|nr:hypothetical protein [Rhodovulum sp. ES.010]SIO03190.1 hypothetical protein SAMN05444722_0176 [Rhodovulum sp. ES.010]
MERLLVINSFGPMASTLVAGLAEKFGYSNIPLRKLRLNKYISGDLSLDSGVMQNRLRENLEAHAKPTKSGGVSVIERDNQAPVRLVDIDRVRDRLHRMQSTRYREISELFSDCHETYSDAVIYKTPVHTPGWHIELCVDFHNFDPARLYDGYRRHFPQVHFIHLHRSFRDWINSLASQAMHQSRLKRRIKFFPPARYRDFQRYEHATSRVPGLHLGFDEMFDTPIEAFAERLASYLGLPVPDVDFRQESYDMYGKLRPYDVAFKRFDDGRSYLQPGTLDRLEAAVESGRIARFPMNLGLWADYVRDMSRYRRTIGEPGK